MSEDGAHSKKKNLVKRQMHSDLSLLTLHPVSSSLNSFCQARFTYFLKRFAAPTDQGITYKKKKNNGKPEKRGKSWEDT